MNNKYIYISLIIIFCVMKNKCSLALKIDCSAKQLSTLIPTLEVLSDSLSEKEKKWAIDIANKAKGNVQIPQSLLISVYKTDSTYVVVYHDKPTDKISLNPDYNLKIIIDKFGKVLKILIP